MKKLLSIHYNEWAFNIGMFILRLIAGCVMLFAHGFDKLQKFNTLQGNFYNFMGLGHRTSLVLDIFAELFCSLFLILGLFTRFSAALLIITMLVVIFGYDAGKPWLQSETAFLYLAGYVMLLLCGPGKISIDGMLNK
jgi:putative oxidoreductase